MSCDFEFAGNSGDPWPAGWTPWIGQSSQRDGGIASYEAGTNVAYLDGQGHGRIKAYKDSAGAWHSAFLYGPTFTYGTVTARVLLPTGQGIFPAFWLVCADCDSGGWPAHGEIDMIETINAGTTRYTTLNYPAGTGDGTRQTQGAFTPGVFHVWSCTWQPDHVSVSLDGVQLVNWTAADVPSGSWCYSQGHAMKPVLNVCIGGSWPGNPDGTTPNAVYLEVDYLKITP